jgi:hypothetical protein
VSTLQPVIHLQGDGCTHLISLCIPVTVQSVLGNMALVVALADAPHGQLHPRSADESTVDIFPPGVLGIHGEMASSSSSSSSAAAVHQEVPGTPGRSLVMFGFGRPAGLHDSLTDEVSLSLAWPQVAAAASRSASSPTMQYKLRVVHPTGEKTGQQLILPAGLRTVNDGQHSFTVVVGNAAAGANAFGIGWRLAGVVLAHAPVDKGSLMTSEEYALLKDELDVLALTAVAVKAAFSGSKAAVRRHGLQWVRCSPKTYWIDQLPAKMLGPAITLSAALEYMDDVIKLREPFGLLFSIDSTACAPLAAVGVGRYLRGCDDLTEFYRFSVAHAQQSMAMTSVGGKAGPRTMQLCVANGVLNISIGCAAATPTTNVTKCTFRLRIVDVEALRLGTRLAADTVAEQLLASSASSSTSPIPTATMEADKLAQGDFNSSGIAVELYAHNKGQVADGLMCLVAALYRINGYAMTVSGAGVFSIEVPLLSLPAPIRAASAKSAKPGKRVAIGSTVGGSSGSDLVDTYGSGAVLTPPSVPSDSPLPILDFEYVPGNPSVGVAALQPALTFQAYPLLAPGAVGGAATNAAAAAAAARAVVPAPMLQLGAAQAGAPLLAHGAMGGAATNAAAAAAAARAVVPAPMLQLGAAQAGAPLLAHGAIGGVAPGVAMQLRIALDNSQRLSATPSAAAGLHFAPALLVAIPHVAADSSYASAAGGGSAVGDDADQDDSGEYSGTCSVKHSELSMLFVALDFSGHCRRFTC